MMSFVNFSCRFQIFILIFVQFGILHVNLTEISIDTLSVIHETDERFIGVAIDSGVIRRHWEHFEPSSPKIRTLSAALAPCYLRVGGTDADFLIFEDDSTSPQVKTQGSRTFKNMTGVLKWQSDKPLKVKSLNESRSELNIDLKMRSRRDVGLDKDYTNFTMSADIYDELQEYAAAVGWGMIFDLNVLLRKEGHWDSTNALKLMKYTADKGYKMAGWELGNEPDEFKRQVGLDLTGAQLAVDYFKMRELIQKFPVFKDCVILGPSVAALSVYWRIDLFNSFLTSGGGDVVTAASFHQYYVNGRIATIDQFYSPDILNILKAEVQIGVNLTRNSGSKAKVWLGETSSAWGGGAEGLSDRYVAAFMWLDKLGFSAVLGADVVIRQSFYGGHYALIDSRTLDPNPDYWLTLLYKLLVGNRVFKVKSPSNLGTLRSYAHCTNTKRSGYSAGSIVVYVVNLNKYDVNVTFPGFPSQKMHVYNMEPENNNLKSQFVLLNGTPLKMVDDSTLPNLLQLYKTTREPVTISAISYSFIVFPDANIQLCK